MFTISGNVAFSPESSTRPARKTDKFHSSFYLCSRDRGKKEKEKKKKDSISVISTQDP